MNGKDLSEDIIFNDADGTDADLDRLERAYHSLCYGECNSWDDPDFFVEASEFGYGIIYDDPKEDVRYSVIISEFVDRYGIYDVYMAIGKSFTGVSSSEYKPDKKIVLHNSKYNYRYFLNYIDNKIDEKSSIKKMRHLVDKFMNLRAFI